MPATFTFTLADEAAQGAPSAAAPAAPIVVAPASTAKKAGLAWPFRVGSNGNPVTVTGDDLREARVAFVVATRASSVRGAGEIPMRMRLGSLAHLLLNTSFGDVREPLAVVYGQRAMASALPNELVVAAEVTSNEDGEVDVVLYVVDRRNAGRSQPRQVPIRIVRKTRRG
jgi:hypothetical protein